MHPEQAKTYTPAESFDEREFYHAMMEDVRQGGSDAKQQWIEQHPERAQEIEIFFDLPDYMTTQKRIAEKEKMSPQERRENFQSLTEWHYLLTNQLIHNAERKEEMRDFWDRLFTLADIVPDGRLYLARTKTGIAAQAATYHILDRLGYSPKLARPADDAFHAEDLTGYSPAQEQAMSIQTKTKKEYTRVRVEKQDHVAYPAIASHGSRVSSASMDDLPHFRGSLAALKERLQQQVVSYRIELPRQHYDMNTGVPTNESVEQVQEQLAVL